jgi:hypothetical protein
MSAPRLAAIRVTAAAALIGWASLSIGGMIDAPPDNAREAGKPPPTRSIDHPTGATESDNRGAVSGGMTTTPQPEKEQQRGNTPPGKDRGGQGPAAGAIVDPSGAATGRKPF